MSLASIPRLPIALRSLCAGLLLAVPAAAQAVLHTWGGATGAGLSAVTAVGDVDLDGKTDLALGAPAENLGRGRVTLVSGATHATLFSVAGTLAGERFGAAVAPAGDVNGDGRLDLLVGAPGSALMTGSATVLSGVDGAVLRTVTGSSLGAHFGAAVAGAGDSNGDGKADLLVGAPDHASGTGSGNGQVTLWSGANGSLLQSVTGSSGDHLGIALGGWSMVDQEPMEIIGLTMEGNGGTGAVQIRSRTTFALLATVPGTTAGASFGASIARLGDVNGDGHPDVAVGAPGNGGSVSVLSGTNWSVLLGLPAPDTGTGFGSIVAEIGDVNGDGRADVAVGAPKADKNGADSGELMAYSGATGALLSSVVGAAAGDLLGSSAASAGDSDGDGRSEFALGSPGSDVAGPEAGGVSVVSLALWNTVENGLPGLCDIPRLVGEGGLVDLSSASLSLTSGRPIAGATLVVGLSMILDAQHGVFVPTPDIVVTGLVTSGEGTLDYTFELATGLTSGSVIYQQFLLMDSSAEGGVSRSNTVAATVP